MIQHKKRDELQMMCFNWLQAGKKRYPTEQFLDDIILLFTKKEKVILCKTCNHMRELDLEIAVQMICVSPELCNNYDCWQPLTTTIKNKLNSNDPELIARIEKTKKEQERVDKLKNIDPDLLNLKCNI
jgi:hypothetical protein